MILWLQLSMQTVKTLARKLEPTRPDRTVDSGKAADIDLSDFEISPCLVLLIPCSGPYKHL